MAPIGILDAPAPGASSHFPHPEEVTLAMKRTLLAIAGVSLMAAGAAIAADMVSGLKPGANVGAFQVVDVSGPNKGKQLCYRCNYGGSPVAAAFIKGDAKESAAVVVGLQKLTEKYQDKGL